MDRKLIIKTLDFNMKYARELLSDVPDELIANCPSPGLENHPAFTLGHLCMASARMVKALGGEMRVPDGYTELFDRKGPGDPTLPSTERAAYPGKESLLRQLETQHGMVKENLLQVSDIDLSKSIDWRFAGYFETKYEMLVFMSASHEAMHLAQIAAWRRSFGLSSAFARIS